MGWYMVITEEMRALGLKGNDLLVYAVIFGYSQAGEGCYYGSLSHLGEVCGIARRTAIDCLNRLCKDGFIDKHDHISNGVRRVSYAINVEKLEGSANSAPGVVQILHGGGANSAPNNKIDKVDIINNISPLINKGAKFQKPTLEEVRSYLAQRRSSVNAEAFYAYYESNGWRVGRNPMKNWKQAVITWEVRDREQPTPAAPSRVKEGFVTRNKRNLEQLLEAYPAAEGGSL